MHSYYCSCLLYEKAAYLLQSYSIEQHRIHSKVRYGFYVFFFFFKKRNNNNDTDHEYNELRQRRMQFIFYAFVVISSFGLFFCCSALNTNNGMNGAKEWIKATFELGLSKEKYEDKRNKMKRQDLNSRCKLKISFFIMFLSHLRLCCLNLNERQPLTVNWNKKTQNKIPCFF